MPDAFPPASRLTHIALEVADVERTVAFYERYTTLRPVHERPDSRTGSKVVWLRDGPRGGLTLVVFKRVAAEGAAGETPAPAVPRAAALHHLGFAVASRAAVDAIAARAEREGVLALPASDHGEVVGYLCQLADPDGVALEFSYGQEL